MSAFLTLAAVLLFVAALITVVLVVLLSLSDIEPPSKLPAPPMTKRTTPQKRGKP